MKRVRFGNTEISAAAICRGADCYISAVTVVRWQGAPGRQTLSLHEWDELVFESEREALRFAWQRAAVMASELARNEG